MEDKKNKIKSRKFLVWLVASLFEAGAIAYGFVTKDVTIAREFIPWWGGISMVYIGANAAQKFVPQKATEETECK